MFWTKKEIDILYKYFPKYGSNYVNKLPSIILEELQVKTMKDLLGYTIKYGEN